MCYDDSFDADFAARLDFMAVAAVTDPSWRKARDDYHSEHLLP